MNADQVWGRIVGHAGEEFRLVRGRPFTYHTSARTIYLHTTNRMISRSAIEKAIERGPLHVTTDVADLSAPSYIYAIVMDPRIRPSDW